jgi:hypothetical protein
MARPNSTQRPKDRGFARRARLAAAVGLALVLSLPAHGRMLVQRAYCPLAQSPGYTQPPQPPAYGQQAQAPVYGQQSLPPGYAQPPQAPIYGQPAQPPGYPQAASTFQPPANGLMVYRGYHIDARPILNSPDYPAIMASMPHQIDIVADCGLRPDVLSFFQSQPIILRPGLRGQFGHFDPHVPGVSIEDAVAAPQKPIVLHELLHAYHWYRIPGGFNNPEILTFYQRARSGQRYPESAYVVKNVQEFFAVTASLYLWGHVDREPFSRENLKARQPVYYAWLGQFFGVAK